MIQKDAIEISLRAIQQPPSVWLDQSMGIQTRLLGPIDSLRKLIIMENEEIPILEYCNNQCYSLITSKRIISDRFGKLSELSHSNIFNARKWIKERGIVDLDKIEPMKILEVKSVNGDIILIEFDKDYPTYFAMILINNFAYKLRTGQWYLNPKQS